MVCYLHKTRAENTQHARTHTHTHADRCSPTLSLTPMTACHSLNVTSQLRPPPCQPQMPPGATIAPYQGTEEGRGTLPQERPAHPREAAACQSGGKSEVGVAHLFSSLNLHIKHQGNEKGKHSVVPAWPRASFCTSLPSVSPLYRGAHVHPRAPLWEAMSGSVSSSPGAFHSLPSSPPQSTWTLVIYIRVCWGPGESGPRHLGQKWISCFRPWAGLCLGSSEHGAPPER